jgi:hypothetical protein
MPREVQEQVFLAASLVADGLGRLLQGDDDEQELAGKRGSQARGRRLAPGHAS